MDKLGAASRHKQAPVRMPAKDTAGYTFRSLVRAGTAYSRQVKPRAGTNGSTDGTKLHMLQPGYALQAAQHWPWDRPGSGVTGATLG